MQNEMNRKILAYLENTPSEKERILNEITKWEIHEMLFTMLQNAVQEIKVETMEDIETLMRLYKLCNKTELN